MKALTRRQYDGRYFDGKDQDYKCSAGYSKYEDRGFQEQADWLFEKFDLKEKRVLDVGCAKGFLVNHLRSLGVDAWGLDWSDYAVEQAESDHIMCESIWDIDSEYDYIISARFLNCFDPSKIKKLVRLLNKHATKQIHFIDLTPNSKYYLAIDLAWWGAQGWAKGTVLIGDSWNNQIII